MSKRIIEHPQETGNGPKYWRSLGQLAGTPEFKQWQEREFQTGASDLNPEVGRRGFVKYMAASAALAGLSLSACRREQKNLVPFSHGVEWSVPGKALFYASSRPHRRGAQPIVVTTHDGRPTKVDGNPLHPASKGASDIHTQSSLLDLYDPDRSRIFQMDGRKSDEVEFMEWVRKEVMEKAGDGSGIAFLTEHFTSHTFGRLKRALSEKLPKALWVAYEPLGAEELLPANEAAFGAGVRAVPQIGAADVILSLDCDFLGFDEGKLDGIRAFSARRSPEQQMNRLYVVENRYTVTGGTADHRLRVPASKVGAVALAIAEKIAEATGDAELKQVIEKFPKVAMPSAAKGPQWIEEAAKDLVAQKGKALVCVGYRQPAEVQVLGYAINVALGALGQTLVGRKIGHGAQKTIADLAKAIEGKEVKTVFIIGGNPNYNAPAELKFAALLKGVTVIRHGMYEDETTYTLDENGKRHFVKWHIPAAHYLEAWGDGFASDGTLVSQQPMILPLFGGWSEIQLLNLLLTGKKAEGIELLQASFEQVARGIDTESWAKFLRDGFLPGGASREPLKFDAAKAADAVAKYKAPKDGIEIVFTSCPKVDDGRYSNNAWLQELPDPITKMTWDNAAIISPKTAERLFSKKLGHDAVDPWREPSGEWISIEVNDATLEIPVYVAPGHADESISIALGYGHTHEGRVGGREGNYMSHGGLLAKKSGVGFNAYPLRTTATAYFAITTSDKVRPVKRDRYPLAATQEHGALEGRAADLIREGTTDTLKHDGDFARDPHWLHEHEAMDAHAEKRDAKNYPLPNSFYSHPELQDKNHQWAMAIDLTTCTGCSACMIACQAENNIPVVGKEQVIEGREMHWIRMDRYFVTGMNDREEKLGGKRRVDTDEPRMVMQPMPCQHCENAPCETVCPVNATVHSEDGLNIMAYNRCIGTRYCANNCPFKVRRFNFFDFNERQKDKYFVPNLINEKGMADTLKMSKNPNVTVRMRGVMEKCTFCVQRVQEAKIAAKVRAKDSPVVKVKTDSFTSACAQVCPTGAITFGNKADEKSAVSKLIENGRGYRLLDYIGIQARVHYLARIMNPNLKMPDVPKDYPELQAAAKGGKA